MATNSETSQPELSQPETQQEGAGLPSRALTALIPERAPIMEWSVADILTWTRNLGPQLRTYNEQNQPEGSWGNFIPADLDLEKVAALLNENAGADTPEAGVFRPEDLQRLRRPHLALFFTFLGLLSQAQTSINHLTRRHLDFYYRQVLGLCARPALPDRVHLMLQASPSTNQTLVKRGTSVSAGTDSQGIERIYSLQRDVVINRAQIAQIRSVRVEREATHLESLRATHKNDAHRLALSLLELALGTPRPGDSLPLYYPPVSPLDGSSVGSGRLSPSTTGSGDPISVAESAAETVDIPWLKRLQRQIQFLEQSLCLKAFELSDLMILKLRREQDLEEWQEINRFLQKAGDHRSKGFSLQIQDPRDFQAHLTQAVGPLDFAGLPQVESIDDLYSHSARPDVIAFIQQQVYFKDPGDFTAMMQIKNRIDGDWLEIRRLLQLSAERKHAGPAAPPELADVRDFTALLTAATDPDFSTLDGIPTVDQLHAALKAAESYFFISIREIGLLLNSLLPEPGSPGVSTDPPNHGRLSWNQVDHLLIRAHRGAARSQRRAILRQIRQTSGFSAMVAQALGEDRGIIDLSTAIPRLELLGVGDSDRRFLHTVWQAIVAGSIDEHLDRSVDGGGESPSKGQGEGDNTSGAAVDWARVERILEPAWRNREGITEPIPRIEKWRHLHAMADATVAQSGRGTEDHPSWSLFGSPSQGTEVGKSGEPMLGWALSTPSLGLSEGRRKIKLSLGFAPESFRLAALAEAIGSHPESPISELSGSHPLRVELSTEEGWLEPTHGTTRLIAKEGELSYLELDLTLPEKFPAVTSLPRDLVEDPAIRSTIDSLWPVLRLRLRSRRTSDHRPTLAYSAFRDLRLATIALQVEVEGLRHLTLQNDQARLDPAKPFEAFGFKPMVGSRLLIAHPELLRQPLSSVAFRPYWMGVPDDLKTHYKHFAATQGADFTVDVSVVERRHSVFQLKGAALFADNTQKGSSPAIQLKGLGTLLTQDLKHQKNLVNPWQTEPLQWPRYFQWRLNEPDFQHSAYPRVAAAKTLELSAALAGSNSETVKPEDFQVNPPYTPILERLEVDYTARLEVSDLENLSGQALRIYHLHPFGYCDARVDGDRSREAGDSSTSFSVDFMPRYDHEGELYLGLSGLEEATVVSMLFQAAEGSADPDSEPAAVRWSVLDHDRWCPLEGHQLLSDSSRGLTTSGILEFALEPKSPAHRLPGGLTWLRASVDRNTESLCDTLALHTQAVPAQLSSEGVSPRHFEQPLAAHSITELKTAHPQITGVSQPFASEGGRAAEQDTLFYTRVSERLRHKGRALTPWDYEHLVLENFPEIFHVKCLSSVAPTGPQEPGNVTLVVVPDIQNRRHYNAFEPRASIELLDRIREFLALRMPAGGSLEVKNPEYVPIKTRFAVRFHNLALESLYRRRLQEDLDRFLSPWAFGEANDIRLGGRIYGPSLLDFVDRLPYVDHVSHLQFFVGDRSGSYSPVHPQADGSYFVAAERPDTLLVSGRDHLIQAKTNASAEESSWTGIGYMKIDLDFQIA